MKKYVKNNYKKSYQNKKIKQIKFRKNITEGTTKNKVLKFANEQKKQSIQRNSTTLKQRRNEVVAIILKKKIQMFKKTHFFFL